MKVTVVLNADNINEVYGVFKGTQSVVKKKLARELVEEIGGSMRDAMDAVENHYIFETVDLE